MQFDKQILLKRNSILHYRIINKFFSSFATIVWLIFTTTNLALATKSDIKEYGIVILLEEKCTKKAEELNLNITKILSDLKNTKNYWHVTLYHGAYEAHDLKELYNKLNELPLKPFTLNFAKIYSTSDRWVDLGAEKTEYLQNLHKSIVQLASPYHKRPLARSKDIYQNMTESQREQVDNYGVSGILGMYNPHMTLFYQYPPSPKLREAAVQIEKSFRENMVCKASKIVLGKLGYNGNIEEIVYSINIPD